MCNFSCSKDPVFKFIIPWNYNTICNNKQDLLVLYILTTLFQSATRYKLIKKYVSLSNYQLAENLILIFDSYLFLYFEQKKDKKKFVVKSVGLFQID